MANTGRGMVLKNLDIIGLQRPIKRNRPDGKRVNHHTVDSTISARATPARLGLAVEADGLGDRWIT